MAWPITLSWTLSGLASSRSWRSCIWRWQMLGRSVAADRVLRSRLSPPVVGQRLSLSLFSDRLGSRWAFIKLDLSGSFSREESVSFLETIQCNPPWWLIKQWRAWTLSHIGKGDIWCWISADNRLVVFSLSAEVNNFLKIDENQNEDVEDELPEHPVSRNCFLVTHFLF